MSSYLKAAPAGKFSLYWLLMKMLSLLSRLIAARLSLVLTDDEGAIISRAELLSSDSLSSLSFILFELEYCNAPLLSMLR